MADLVKTQLGKSLRVSTLDDLIRVKTSEEVYLLIDVSGSMREGLRNGKERIEGLREVVKGIQVPGRSVKLIAFGGNDGGAYVTTTIPHPGGGTPLNLAIDLAKAKNAGRAIVISDGQPDSPNAALESAKSFGGKIDVVFVGNPGEFGESFLRELAESTGGVEFHGDLGEPKALGQQIIGLLDAGTPNDEEDAAIQL